MVDTFLQALGAGIAIAGSYLVISDANNENFTGTSKGPLLTGVGAGLSLVGFLLTWSAGDKINYDNDIANYKKKSGRISNHYEKKNSRCYYFSWRIGNYLNQIYSQLDGNVNSVDDFF